MIINERIIQEYRRLQEQLEQWLKLSPVLTLTYLANQMKMSRFTFRERMKKRGFTVSEMERLAKILNEIRIG